MLEKFTKIVLPCVFAGTFVYMGVTRGLPELHVKFFNYINKNQYNKIGELKCSRKIEEPKNTNQYTIWTLGKYVPRFEPDREIRKFLSITNNKVCIVHGPNGYGKTHAVNSHIENFLTKFIIKIKADSNFSLEATIIKNINDVYIKDNKDNNTQGFVSSIKKPLIQHTTNDDIVEALIKFRQQKFYSPNVVFDFEEANPIMFEKVLKLAYAIAPHSQCFIIVDEVPQTHVKNDTNEHYIYVGEFDSWEIWRYMIGAKVNISNDDGKTIYNAGYRKPEILNKIIADMKSGLTLDECLKKQENTQKNCENKKPV